MKTDNSRLFELVEPPADGEKALRARLLLDEQGRTDWRWGLAARYTVRALTPPANGAMV